MKFRKTSISTVMVIALLFFARMAFAAIDGAKFLRLCERGTIEEIKSAIKDGANVNAKKQSGETALFSAIVRNDKNLELASLLVEKGADVNARDNGGATVLMMTAYVVHDPIPMARFLLANGADVNLQENREGLTALMFALVQNVFLPKDPAQVEKLISFLLDSGANPNLKDKRGDTAFDIALKMGYKDTLIKRLKAVTASAKSK